MSPFFTSFAIIICIWSPIEPPSCFCSLNLAKSSASEDLYLYGSFVDLKFFQPDLNKIYFDEALRGVTKIKIPKGQTEVNDWRKYYYNLEILFNNFTKNIIKQDKKWLKETTKNKIKKDLKNLKTLLEKVK